MAFVVVDTGLEYVTVATCNLEQRPTYVFGLCAKAAMRA